MACVFQKQIPADGVVLELGAGYGDFINAVKARRRLAVDQWPGMSAHLAPGVEGLVTRITQLDAVADGASHITVKPPGHAQAVVRPGPGRTMKKIGGASLVLLAARASLGGKSRNGTVSPA